MKSSQTLELLSAEVPQRFQLDSSCRRVNLSFTSPTINLHFCFLYSINANNIQDIPLPKEVKSSANTRFNSRKKRKQLKNKEWQQPWRNRIQKSCRRDLRVGGGLKIFFFYQWYYNYYILSSFPPSSLPSTSPNSTPPPPPLLLFFHSEKGRPSVDINRA